MEERGHPGTITFKASLSFSKLRWTEDRMNVLIFFHFSFSLHPAGESRARERVDVCSCVCGGRGDGAAWRVDGVLVGVAG